jgi:hypothetical protein
MLVAITFESQNIRCEIEKCNVDGGKPFVELTKTFCVRVEEFSLGCWEQEKMREHEISRVERNF